MIDPTTLPTFQKLLVLEEEFRSIPYRDDEGNETLGIGWNIRSLPMTLEQALAINRDHIRYFEKELQRLLSFYDNLDQVRQCVLVDMAFNMGIEEFMGFKRFLHMIELGGYDEAAQEMLNSVWDKEVKTRAIRLSKMMETGQWPNEVE